MSQEVRPNWCLRLNRVLDRHGIKGSAIVRECGMTKNRVSHMRAGHEPRVTDAIKVANFLGWPVEELFSESPDQETVALRLHKPSPRTPVAVSISPGAYNRRRSMKVAGASSILEGEDFKGDNGFVPVLAWVAAGLPREAHDGGYPTGSADAYVQFDTDDPNAFALRVDGNSMSPDFKHGNIIVASPKLGHGNDTYRDGMAAVVIFSSERTATFKIVRYGQTSPAARPMDYVLESLNPDFPPMRLKVGEIAAIYPVVGLIRMEEGQ